MSRNAIKLDTVYQKCSGEYVMTMFFGKHDKTKEDLLIYQYLADPQDISITTTEDFTAVISYKNELQPKFKLIRENVNTPIPTNKPKEHVKDDDDIDSVFGSLKEKEDPRRKKRKKQR